MFTRGRLSLARCDGIGHVGRMIVPLDALPGFSLAAEQRYVCAYYAIKPRSLKRLDPRHGANVGLARDALAYRLIVKHNWPAERAAPVLGLRPEALRAAARRHEAAINLFIETHRDNR